MAAHREGKAARDAYQKALNTYKDSLSAKEYAKITVPAKLEDLLHTTQRIEAKHKTGRTIRLLASLQKGQARLERFNRILEGGLKIMTGGELIWASISYVFTVRKNVRSIMLEGGLMQFRLYLKVQRRLQSFLMSLLLSAKRCPNLRS